MNRKLLFFSILLIANHDIRSMELPRDNKHVVDTQKKELKDILVQLKQLRIASTDEINPSITNQQLKELTNIQEQRTQLMIRRNKLINGLGLDDIGAVLEEVNRRWSGGEEMV